jgi:tRNA (adenine57-N1/adenine58-N1)-methyltransferase
MSTSLDSKIVSKGSDFLRRNDIVEEGDTVIIYVNHNTSYAIVTRRGMTLNMKYGALRHEFVIGKRYGTQISATAGYVYILRPTPDLWTKTLQRRTQILYTPDIAMILMLLDARPGSVICETGTGSGSLTHAIAVAIAPNGHLYSHDIDESRVKTVENDLKNHGLSGNSTVVLQNTCEVGFCVEDACDSVFLDLPAPWTAIAHAKRAINGARGGRLVSFSPCIEQVQRVCEELEAQGFVQLQTIEIVPRKLKVIKTVSETLEETARMASNSNGGDSKRPQKRKATVLKQDFDSSQQTILDCIPFPAHQPTHSGYLTSATLLPNVKQNAVKTECDEPSKTTTDHLSPP